jgi:hypothetical protein
MHTLEASAALVHGLPLLAKIDYPLLPRVTANLSLACDPTAAVAAIEKLGVVTRNDADATKCRVSGVGIKDAVVGQETSIAVELCDAQDTPLHNLPEDVVAAMVSAVATAGTEPLTTLPVRLTATAGSESGGTTVTCWYQPTDVTPIVVDLRVLGEHVIGSPFTVVPSVGVEVLIKLWGAGGAGGRFKFGNHGGAGGFISARYAWQPGDELVVTVGGGGTTHTSGTGSGVPTKTPEGGGYPNGGHARGSHDSGGGGGSTHVVCKRTSLVILGAGGGGGGAGGKEHGCGGGGGGGTQDGFIGQGGNGQQSRFKEGDHASTHGGGCGGHGYYQSVVKGADNNGAGGCIHYLERASTGGGGSGGACSHKGVIDGREVAVVNGMGHAPVNPDDPHFVPGCGAGGDHGCNPGRAGLAVLVLAGGHPPIVLDSQGEYTIPFPRV